MTDADLTTLGLDPVWVGQVAASAGVGTVEATFAGFVGTGQLSRMARFSLDWLTGDGPASVLVKLPSAVGSTREMAFRRDVYRKECEFYRTAVTDLEVITPLPFHVHFDGDALDFAIVMEDVTTHTAGDQLSGTSIAGIEAALVQAAALHSGCWGQTSAAAFDVFHEDVAAAVARTERAFPSRADKILDRWAGLIEPDVVEFVQRFAPVVGAWRRQCSPPVTLVHGDFRPDNLLFGPAGDSRPIVVVDWQLAKIGLPAIDVAFLIGGALSSDQRRDYESQLIETYLLSLGDRGIEVVSDSFLNDYALSTIHGIVVAISAAATVDRTERGEALLSTMLNRHGRHAIEWDALTYVVEAR